MKTKKFTRFLSGFLAVLMLMTMAPVTAFSANEDDLDKLETAITAYENKMDNISDRLYTNMSPAYDAYMNAKGAVDAYVYGGNTSLDLAGLATTLTSATSNMGTYTPNTTANVQVLFNANDASNVSTSSVSQKILYVPSNSSESIYNAAVSSLGGLADARIHYTDTVLLYDDSGIVPQIPIVAYFYRRTATSTFYINSAYPSSLNDDSDYGIFKMKETWKDAGGTSANYAWTLNNVVAEEGYNQATKQAYSRLNSNTGSDWKTNSQARYIAGALQFSGSFENGVYSGAYNIPWRYSISTAQTSGYTEAAATAEKTVYVINYKAVLDALKDSKSVLQNIESYDSDETDMKTFMSNIDAAMTVNPSGYNYSSGIASAVSSCDTAIRNAVEGITDAKKELEVDNLYAALRNALKATKPTIIAGNNDNYTAASWDAFTDAYDLGVAAMQNAATNGYHEDYDGVSISVIASNLMSAYNALEFSDSKLLVGYDALEKAITAYESRMSSIGDRLYTNMSAAYDAYITAKKAMDAYAYGGNRTADLGALAAKLTSATNAMGTFTAKTTDKKTYYSSESTSDRATTAEYCKNLLYAVNSDVNGYPMHFENSDSFRRILLYNTAVMMYDGEIDPQLPIVARGAGVSGSSKSRRFFGFYPTLGNNDRTDSTEFSLINKWRGSGTSDVVNFGWYIGQNGGYGTNASGGGSGRGAGFNNATTVSQGTSYNTNDTVNVSDTQSATNTSNGTPMNLANVLKFSGTFGSNEYSKTCTPWWYMLTGGDASNQAWAQSSSSYPIYVINYKAILDALKGSKSVLQNIGSYDGDADDIMEFMAKIDDVMAVDPTSYDYAANTSTAVDTCAYDIRIALEGFTAAKNSLDVDNLYAALRTALNKTKSIYTAGNESGTYTAASWTAFTDAYDLGIDAMKYAVANAYPSKYNDTSISDIASGIMTAFDALVPPATQLLPELEDAMAAYLAKMDGTSYTNMLPAYNAYLAAKDLADSLADDMDSYEVKRVVENLKTATENMGTFTPQQGTATASFYTNANGNTTAYGDGGYSENLLQAPQTTNVNGGSDNSTAWSYTNGNFYVNLFYRDIVMLYDGETPAQMPVMAGYRNNAGAATIYSVYPSAGNGDDNDSSQFSFIGPWKDNGAWNLDFSWSMTQADKAGYDKATSQNTYSLAVPQGAWIGEFQMANVLQFSGDLSNNQYYVEYYPWFCVRTSLNPEGVYLQSTEPIYVVNYKTLTNAIKLYPEVLADVGDYEDTAKVQSLLAGIDKATSINTLEYDRGSWFDVWGLSGAIQDAVESIKKSFIGEYAALDAAVANAEAVLNANRQDYYDKTAYSNVEALKAEVMSGAYNGNINNPILCTKEQGIIDDYVARMLTAYNNLHAKNYFTVTFNVYVDGAPYDDSVTAYEVRSKAELTSSYKTGTATWYVDGVEQKNVAGYEYSFIVTRDVTVECKIEGEETADTTKIIVLTSSNETYKEYNVASTMTVGELVGSAEIPTVAYHQFDSWTINGKNSNTIASDAVSTLGAVVKLRPKYISTSEGYTFDEKKTITYDDTETFLCWVLPVVGTDSYRVVSYSEEYLYFTTGVGGPEAVTEANFSSYQGKLQGVTSDEQGTIRDMIDKKMPIPSMRGSAEDTTSANGALWDKDIKQLRIISQFTEGYDKSKYTIVDCGVKLARNGSSAITTALSRTISEQYIVYYSFNSWTDAIPRTYSAQSWVTYKIDSGETVTVYSPEAQFNLSLA